MADPFQEVAFLKSAIKPQDYPTANIPEIAVVGRSNVGKSSLLNSLFKRKDLVKTSATPGKTRHLNFFQVGQDLLCVDLPGYGYAKVSKKEQEGWGRFIDTYLNERKELRMILFLFDIRREPKEDEYNFLAWAKERGLPLLVVITKADKIAKTKRQARAQKLGVALGDVDYLLYSVPDKLGRSQLASAILSVVRNEKS